MIGPQTKKQLEELGATISGVELFQHYEEEIARLNKVEGVSSWEEILRKQGEISAIKKFLAIFKRNSPEKTEKVHYN